MRKQLPAPHRGTLTVHDARIDADHQLPITALEFRDGLLQITAEGAARLDGSIEPDDVMTIRDPDGREVLRTWVHAAPLQFHARERVTVTYGIPLGGRRPIVTGDAGLDISL